MTITRTATGAVLELDQEEMTALSHFMRVGIEQPVPSGSYHLVIDARAILEGLVQ